MAPRIALTSATLAFTYKTLPPSFSILSMVRILALTGSSAGWLAIHVSQAFLAGRLERPTNTRLALYFSARYSEIATPILPSPPVIRYTPPSRRDDRP